MEPNKPFPIYQLQDAFESFCNSEPAAKPQHRSLYYFLLGYCRRRGNTPRFSLAYEAGMHGSGIGSWATYDTALKTLAEWGFIVYTPGANRYKVPVVELTFRNPTDDVLLTYWQSYCLSTANPTDDVLLTQVVTLKEVVNKERRESEKLESEKAQYQAEVVAANAALADSQKKIAQLEHDLQEWKMLAETSTLQAESPTPGLRTLGGPADVATPIEAGQGSDISDKPDMPPKANRTRPKRTVPTRRPEVAFSQSEFASYDQFAAAFEGTDYALLDLRFYHEKILNWRQKGDVPTRKDWLATAKQFFLNDRAENRLQLAPGTEHYNHAAHGGIGANAVVPNGASGAFTGQAATGYRSSRYD